MDPAGKIVVRSFSGPSNPYRVGVESSTREIEKAADLCLQEAGARRNAVAAIGAGLAGTGKPELKEGVGGSSAAGFADATVKIFNELETAPVRARGEPLIVRGAG